MMKAFRFRTMGAWAAASALVLAMAACGGGGGGSSTSVAAPSSLSYSANPATFTSGTAITSDVPSNAGGAVTTYTVSPPLPAGLALNPATGVITGTPTAAAAMATYTVTASNSAGSTLASVVITVKAPRLAIATFSVTMDETLTFPNVSSSPPYLTNFPDEHETFIPIGPGANDYLVFGASRLNTIPTGGGAVVLQTSDLSTFQFATALGYSQQVMAPPVAFTACDPAYATEFDENYAAPGSVLQDPTLPAGNLIMLYEAENHCPGGVNQTPFYATIGLARSSDNGKTWPGPANAPLGNASRYPVLVGPNPQPSTPTTVAMGDAIPSGFVDTASNYLYVLYSYQAGGLQPAGTASSTSPGPSWAAIPWSSRSGTRAPSASPGSAAWKAASCPAPSAPEASRAWARLSYNDDLGLYLLTYLCRTSTEGAWYFSTATSLDLMDWSTPQMIANSQYPVTSPCPGSTIGADFDGFYPTFMSPGAAAGHTKLTGKAFFLNGCDQGKRGWNSRDFTITLAQAAARPAGARP